MPTDVNESTRWITVYPAYLSNKRTQKEGRRVAKALAIDTPLAQEIYDVCKATGLNVELQKDKMYPRDQNRDGHFQGRCKVRLFDENGMPVNEEIKSRHALFVHLAHMIPKLKTRQQRGAAPMSSETSSASGGRKKKKK